MAIERWKYAALKTITAKLNTKIKTVCTVSRNVEILEKLVCFVISCHVPHYKTL